MFDRARLAIAATLSWWAAKVGPKSMRTVFDAYNRMLVAFPHEFRSGRTYGVVIVPWHSNPSDAEKADIMRDRCSRTAKTIRRQIEAGQ